MKKPILSLILIWMTALPGVLAQKVVTVSKTGSINSIQQGINLAEAFDTLQIQKGRYLEYDVIIDKPLVILGEEGTIIDGDKKGFVIMVASDDVSISRLEVWNASTSFMEDYAGILIEGVKRVTVENVKLRDNYFGIYLAQSSEIKLLNNHITATGKRETTSGNGIHLWYSKNVEISQNYIQGHRDGIYLEFVENTHIYKNLTEKNIRYGIHFMYSDNCKYEENTFRDNGGGVAVMYTTNVEIINNRFEKNWGSSAYGLLLKEINRSNISGNEFAGNSVGLYIEASSRNSFEKNRFNQNGWAVKLMANSTDNIFSKNNFIANTFEVSTNSRQNFNEFAGNYWSQYEGYDLDKDGIGDVPHRPVRLFSILIEKQPQSLLLLRSLLVDILDAAEKFMPLLTPETLIDAEPLMKESL